MRAAEALAATQAAREAYAAAAASLDETTARSDELLAAQRAARTRLESARVALSALDGQRRTYQDYLAAVGAAQAGSSAPALRRPFTPVVQAAAVRPRASRSSRPRPDGTVAPAAGWRSSGFGPRGGTIHYGQDIANDIGTPIVSVQAGTVLSAGPASGFGLWVQVLHDDGTVTVYGHNDYNVVAAGARVQVGEQIAVVGNRGESTGAYVHFEVSPGGYGKVDPLRWLRSRGVDL